MFCPKCGKENVDGVGFCGSCGAPLKKEMAAITLATAPTESVQRSVKNGRLIGVAAAIVVVIVVVAGIATSGFGLFGGVKGSTNDYTWKELSEISKEIAAAENDDKAVEIARKYNLTSKEGTLDGTQVKTVQLSNGASVEVQIAGFRHDDKTSGGKAGITFIFKDAIAEHSMNSPSTSAGGWKDSQMRSWLATDGMNMLPSELSNEIVEVDKMTNNVGETQSVSSVTLTSDKLWLFSATELWGTIDWETGRPYCNDIWNAEGVEYKLFRDQATNSADNNNILMRTFNGNSCCWWERSADPYGSFYFRYVDKDGSRGSGGNFASASYPTFPGFCL